MDPFQAAQWLLAAELSALLGEAARWDWSDSHQRAARLARDLAADAYTGRDLTFRSDLFDDLGEAVRFSDFEWFGSKSGVSPLVSPDADHPLDRIEGWRKEAVDLFYRLYRLTFPMADHEPTEPPALFE